MGMGNSFETITVLQYRLKEAQDVYKRQVFDGWYTTGGEQVDNCLQAGFYFDRDV